MYEPRIHYYVNVDTTVIHLQSSTASVIRNVANIMGQQYKGRLLFDKVVQIRCQMVPRVDA